VEIVSRVHASFQTVIDQFLRQLSTNVFTCVVSHCAGNSKVQHPWLSATTDAVRNFLLFTFSRLILFLIGFKTPSKKFVLFNGCGEIVASRLARRRIQHGKTSHGWYVLTIHLKRTHDRQGTNDCLVCFLYRLIPMNNTRCVLYSIILPHECTKWLVTLNGMDWSTRCPNLQANIHPYQSMTKRQHGRTERINQDRYSCLSG
jgi:hypothetical protein